jgi:hypothetical protein
MVLARALRLAWTGFPRRSARRSFLSRDEVQELLGLKSRQAVHDLAKRGRLLALAAQSGRAPF